MINLFIKTLLYSVLLNGFLTDKTGCVVLYMCQVLVRIVSQSSQWTHHLLAPGHRCLIKVTRIIILQVSPPSLVGLIIIAFYQHLPRVRESQVQQPDRPVSAKTRRAPVTGPGTRRSDGNHWISGVC